MRPVLFRIPLPWIGSVPIYGYGLMLAIAFLVAMYTAARRAGKKGIPPQIISDLGLWLLLSAVVGARIFHVIQHPDLYDSFMDVVGVWRGGLRGLAFYGGFILALVTSVLYLRRKKLSISEVADIIAPSAILGVSIGRIGCFLAGCCFGKPTSSFCGVSFPQVSLAWSEIGSQKVHPTQLYSSASLFSIFIILLILRRYMRFSGQLSLLSILMYSIHRFFIDFLRHYTPDERIGSLATSQVMSIVIGAIALAAMIFFTVRSGSPRVRGGSPVEEHQPRQKGE